MKVELTLDKRDLWKLVEAFEHLGEEAHDDGVGDISIWESEDFWNNLATQLEDKYGDCINDSKS